MTDYEKRVQELEAEGLTRSDAQGVADAEAMENDVVKTMHDEKLSPEDVLDDRQFEAIAEAVADYLSEVTGYCVESLSIGLDVTYTLDTSDEESKQ